MNTAENESEEYRKRQQIWKTIRAYRVVVSILILAFVAGGVGLFLGGKIPTWYEIPKWVRILLLGTVVSPIIGVPLGYVGVNKYFDFLKQVVWEVDASRGFHVRGYRVPPEWWENRTVEEGEAYYNDDNQPIVKHLTIDEEEEKIIVNEGNWAGEMTDTELMTWEFALNETQTRQRFWTQIGKSLKAKLPYYLRSLEQSITDRVARKTMERTSDTIDLYEEEVVEDADVMVESLDVPEGYYSESLKTEMSNTEAKDMKEQIGEMIDEDTDGAWSEVDGDNNE